MQIKFQWITDSLSLCQATITISICFLFPVDKNIDNHKFEFFLLNLPVKFSVVFTFLKGSIFSKKKIPTY